MPATPLPESVSSSLDRALAGFVLEQAELADDESRERLADLVIRVSAAITAGHSCIRINPQEQTFLDGLEVVSEQGVKPLVREQDRLYFQRYWQYENRLVEGIRQRLQSVAVDSTKLDSLLDKYFGPEPESDDAARTNWQRKAAANAAVQRFSIITGGPGTGKTTTVLRTLAVLQELHGKSLDIAMAAPTGKAAMRLQESVLKGKSKEKFEATVADSIPETASTVHRLLKSIPGSVYFRHNPDNPLLFDLVVVDEASMVDLSLMSKLMEALKPGARLILLGDRDQLASVESGAVLADLSQALPANTSELKKHFRFNEDIKAFALAINAQQADSAWAIAQSLEYPAIRVVTDELLGHMFEQYQGYLQAVKNDGDINEIFAAFQGFQVLCSNRRGRFGVENINTAFERLLPHRAGIRASGNWYPGKPVMITRNDASLDLFNGDIGICLRDEHSAELIVQFLQADGKVKRLLPMRLPHHETAWAMTIHKSQGSEFNRVLMVLPEKVNPLLTRELVYTAVTRAKEEVQLAVSEAVFRQALQTRVERSSGLVEKLQTPS